MKRFKLSSAQIVVLVAIGVLGGFGVLSVMGARVFNTSEPTTVRNSLQVGHLAVGGVGTVISDLRVARTVISDNDTTKTVLVSGMTSSYIPLSAVMTNGAGVPVGQVKQVVCGTGQAIAYFPDQNTTVTLVTTFAKLD